MLPAKDQGQRQGQEQRKEVAASNSSSSTRRTSLTTDDPSKGRPLQKASVAPGPFPSLP